MRTNFFLEKKGTKDTSTEWRVNGKINFHETNHSTLQEGVYLEVLDIFSKVLVRFHVDEDWNGGNPLLTGYGNATPIPIGPKSLFNPVVNQFQNLDILMRAGMASFTYANFPSVTSPILDSTGIWTAPKTLRLNFFTNGSSYLRVIDIDGFRFNGK